MTATPAYAPFVKLKGREAQRAGYARGVAWDGNVTPVHAPQFPHRRESTGAVKEGNNR